MKVFLAWSGAQSKAIAEALHAWLPLVLTDAVEPWMSERDIARGEKWSAALDQALNDSGFGGIVCVTPTNTTKPWLLYEAGSLSCGGRRACTFLFRVDIASLPDPLREFQSTRAEDKDQVLHMVEGLNEKLRDKGRRPKSLEGTFAALWPHLQTQLAAIGAQPDDEAAPAPPDTAVVLNNVLQKLSELSIDLPAQVASGFARAIKSLEPPTMYIEPTSDSTVGTAGESFNESTRRLAESLRVLQESGRRFSEPFRILQDSLEPARGRMLRRALLEDVVRQSTDARGRADARATGRAEGRSTASAKSGDDEGGASKGSAGRAPVKRKR